MILAAFNKYSGVLVECPLVAGMVVSFSWPTPQQKALATAIMLTVLAQLMTALNLNYTKNINNTNRQQISHEKTS